MTKVEYINSLKSALLKYNVKNIEDIIADYEEHFAHGLAQGKAESDVCKKLGNPDTIAKAFETESLIVEVKDKTKPFNFTAAISIIVRLIVLAPFNFLVLSIPGAILVSLIVAGWASLLALAGVSLAAFFVGLQTGLLALSFWIGTSIVSLSLFFLSLTVVGALIMFFISKHFLLMVINYFQWNLKFITQK